MFFLKFINFFLNITFALINKINRLFYNICYTFFTFLRKQGKSVVSDLIRAVILIKNLKNIVKQCVSYANFTIFLTEIEFFFHCLHIFPPLCLRPLKKLTNQCVANIQEIRSKCAEKKIRHSHFLN